VVADNFAYPRDGEFLALAEIHAAALRHLPRDVTVYLESGAGTEQTLRANRDAFGRWLIRPRPMSGVNDPKTNIEFLGIPLSVPLLTAPFGGDALFSHDGHLAVARANAAASPTSRSPRRPRRRRGSGSCTRSIPSTPWPGGSRTPATTCSA